MKTLTYSPLFRPLLSTFLFLLLTAGLLYFQEGIPASGNLKNWVKLLVQTGIFFPFVALAHSLKEHKGGA